MDNDKKGKVAWNTSADIIQEISALRSKANNAYINGEIFRSLKVLVSMKQSTIQSLTQEEREKLKELEKKFFSISSALKLKGSFNKKDTSTYNLAIRMAEKLQSDYNELLMDILEERGYLVSEEVDVSKMKF